MTARRVTSLAILGAFLALAVLSVLGNLVLGILFVLVAGVVLGHHAVRLCPHCSNLECAFNPRFSQSDTVRRGETSRDEAGYSDLPITRTTVMPLLLVGPLAFVGAWLYNPAAASVIAVVALTAHTIFRRLTCSHCGNDCAGNCNAVYRKWKRTQLDTRV